MRRLAKLAATYEQTTRMESTIFDMQAVDRVVQEVEDFTDHDDFFARIEMRDPESDVNSRQNRLHCVEAWRHAILLYAQRVFKPVQDAPDLQRITRLSRVILDCVRCIPFTETIQKQVLLPVFLAAAEVGNEWNRDLAREYCRHWGSVSNFDQFDTVGKLLEEVWGEWSPTSRSEYWWGLKVPSALVLRESGLPMAHMLQLG